MHLLPLKPKNKSKTVVNLIMLANLHLLIHFISTHMSNPGQMIKKICTIVP